MYKKSRSEGFGPEVQRRIMAGTFVLSHGYYDAYYTKGQKVRMVLKKRTDEILSEADFILTPTTPAAAFPLNGLTDPIQMYLQDIFTVHANLTGNPAISLPIGKDANGLPFGIQIMARNFEEKHCGKIGGNIMESMCNFTNDFSDLCLINCAVIFFFLTDKVINLF